MAAALPYPVLEADRRRRQVITPEGIALPFTVGSRGARFGALMIDLILIGLAMIVTTLTLMYLAFGVFDLTQTLEGAADSPGAAAIQFLAIVWIAAMFLFRNAWFLYFELRPRGATPGKRMAGLRIAARDGGQLTAEAVIARNMIRDIELFLPLVFLASASDGGDWEMATLAGLVWVLVFALFPLFNRDALRAGDIIAGTWVVEAPRHRLEQVLATAQRGPAADAAPPPVERFRFSDAELDIYGEYELKVLERVLRENRGEAIVAVSDTICRKIGWEPGGTDQRDFLEAYYTQLRARLEGGMRFGRRKADKFAGEG